MKNDVAIATLAVLVLVMMLLIQGAAGCGDEPPPEEYGFCVVQLTSDECGQDPSVALARATYFCPVEWEPGPEGEVPESEAWTCLSRARVTLGEIYTARNP